MFCEICKKKITQRRHLFNLFRINTHHICEFCYQKYPLLPRRSTIPIGGGVMIWNSLIKTSDEISSFAHMSFYKPYIIDYIKNYNLNVLIIEDYLDQSMMEIYDKIKLGDIYLITLYDKIKQKEINYEI